MTNEQRAQRAWQACALYDESVSEPETAAIDLLTDLMHLAEARGWTFGELVNQADQHYSEERDV